MLGKKKPIIFPPFTISQFSFVVDSNVDSLSQPLWLSKQEIIVEVNSFRGSG